MSELLPYEQELAKKFQELPLPDNNMAWADMKRRLDDDDDDGIIPFWLRGCALWGLLGILLLGIGLWWFHSKKSASKNQQAEKVTTVSIKENNLNDDRNKVKLNDTIYIVTNSVALNKKDSATLSQPSKHEQVESLLITPVEKNNQPKTKKDNDTRSLVSKDHVLKKKKIIIPGHIKASVTNGENGEVNNGNKKTEIKKNKAAAGNNIAKNNEDNVASVTTEDKSGIIQSSSIAKPKAINNIDTVQKISHDSSQKTSIDSIQKKNKPEQKITVAKQKTDTSKPKNIRFSVGIAMNQQLPIDGQQWISYNSSGRNGSLADYIPSVYVRMYSGNKWFVQAEFRYGAPQATKDIIYQQKIDTPGAPPSLNNDTSIHLRKTYYQQLPVTVNYFITPNLSLGTGFIFNKFSSAVSEQEITQYNSATGRDSIISKGVIMSQKRSDSNFVSMYIQSVFEAQYKWKKLSAGIRYAFGIQPYIKFTLPGGATQQEKKPVLSFIYPVRIMAIKTQAIRNKAQAANNNLSAV